VVAEQERTYRNVKKFKYLVRYLYSIMKSINIYLDDDEFDALKEKKGDLSWHDFILQLIREDEK